MAPQHWEISLVFSITSSLLEVLPDHLNAEIVAGTITSKQDAMDYLTWTYFFRRLLMNPSYYELEDTENESVNKFLSGLVEESITQLERSACVEIGEVRWVVSYWRKKNASTLERDVCEVWSRDELKKLSSRLLDNLSDCLICAPEKFLVSSMDSNPWPLWCRCSALTNWAMKPLRCEKVNLLASYVPVKWGMMSERNVCEVWLIDVLYEAIAEIVH